ncbi:hypothetical protein ACNHYB_13550 [Isoptericola jiangsuensis]|uniref:restriction system modified-DNA reader domain-containing protein n=1 Tax=Isoptericola jiangsuensis TaxID=548579 RepID=UPI003AAEF079
MPLFEVDASRPLLVQTGRSAGAVEPSLGTTAHRVVDSHIDGLLGEQIFPVAQGVGPDEPHLLALDATGSPVVVELVAELDRGALTKALDHAGWAGRLTRGEIASRYHGGPNAFQRDVAAFYDSVPITRSQPGRSSARLIVICQEAGEEILNAVDFLRQPTMPVEVLKMGVMHSQDGRRFVDVSPLVIHPASGATSPQLSGVAPASASSASGGAAEDGTFADGVKVGIALTDRSPAAAAPPRGATRADVPGTSAQPIVPRPAFARSAATNAPEPAEQPADEPTTSQRARRTAAPAVGSAPAAPGAGPGRGREDEAPGQAPQRRSRAERRAQAGTPSLSIPQVGSAPHAPDLPPPPPPAAPTSSGPAPAPFAAPSRHAPVPPPPDGPTSPSTSRSGGHREAPRDDAPQAPGRQQADPPRRRTRADRFRASEPSEVSPELAAFTAASAASAQDLDLAELARRTTSPASADTPGLGEDFARVAASSFPVAGGRAARRDAERRDLPREPAPREPAPWDPPAPGIDPLDSRVPLSAMDEREWEPSTPDRWTSASDDLPRLSVPPLEAPSYTPPPERDYFEPAPGVAAPVEEVDGDLIALASMLAAPARLVWSRPRRRQHFEAVLTPEGFIVLPDGSRFQHPDRAATVACGMETDDGWNVWRIEPDGISLLEAYRARFA